MTIFDTIRTRITQETKPPSRRAQEVLDKHENENIPIFPNAKVIFMVPAFREMSNGNIPFQLFNLALPEVPKKEVAIVYVINNTKQHSFLAEQYSLLESHRYSELLQKYRAFLAKKNAPATQDEGEILFLLSDFVHYPTPQAEQDLQRMISKHVRTYQENQASIQILRHLSRTQENISRQEETLNPEEKKRLLQSATLELESLWQESFSDLPLPKGLVTALARGVQVAVVDCSSKEQGFEDRNIGQAKNEGLHMSFSHIGPNARFVQPIDADTYPPPGLIKSLLRAGELPQIEAVLVPHYTNTKRLPEQLEGVSSEERIKDIISYYRMTLFSKLPFYAETNREELGGSQVAVSRAAYQTVEYPMGTQNTDYMFSSFLIRTLKPSKVLRLTNPNVMLNLIHRGRKESIDGSTFRGNIAVGQTIDQQHEHLTNRASTHAFMWMTEHQQILKSLESFNVSYTNIYLDYLKNYQEKVHQDRTIFLRRFRQLLPIFMEAITSTASPKKSTIEMEEQLPSILRGFVQDNHLLFSTLIEHLRTEGITETHQIEGFLEKFLPEYFLPIPKNEISLSDHLQAGSRNEFLPGFSQRDFLYLPLAKKAFISHLINEGKRHLADLIVPRRS